MFKFYYGFDSKYLPFSYFFPYIIRSLNPIEYSRVYSNKGMLYSIFNGVEKPLLVARKVNGIIFSGEGDIISEDQLIDNILSCNFDVIVKKSLDTSGGRNIEIIKRDSLKNKIKEIIDLFSYDFLVQKVISGSIDTSKFNPSSLNTIRVTTLLLNGKCSLCTAMLKIGIPGGIVDNLRVGGVFVGINDDGSFMEYGFDGKYEKVYSYNSIPFNGNKIENFDKVVEMAIKAHYYIPQCMFVGWDIALDENKLPILIESNVLWPGLLSCQLANGRPVFRGREEELLKYLSGQPFPYGKIL